MRSYSTKTRSNCDPSGGASCLLIPTCKISSEHLICCQANAPFRLRQRRWTVPSQRSPTKLLKHQQFDRIVFTNSAITSFDREVYFSGGGALWFAGCERRRALFVRSSLISFFSGAGGSGAGRPNCRSSAKLTRSTLTLRSPNIPKVLPSTFASTAAFTRSAATPRALATRGSCQSIASGERCGSSPLADAVTSSAGTGPVASGFSAFKRLRSSFIRSCNFFDVGPRLEPDEDVAS